MFKKITGMTPGQYARAVRDTTKAGKEADLSDVTGESDAMLLQDVDDLDHWVDLCQAQLDAAIIPHIDFTMDDLIDWNNFDDTMMNVKESNALNSGLGA
ncbi:hypothetical protein LTR74_017555 [Friedmanniomyces endolithicus]|nr:hypothetical protein LTS00_018263 [Friedmanniomyces endolithicus]KAK1048407.1 hypothetical protein LTR74_017555 [Friedmanniomyces endolithicus]